MHSCRPHLSKLEIVGPPASGALFHCPAMLTQTEQIRLLNSHVSGPLASAAHSLQPTRTTLSGCKSQGLYILPYVQPSVKGLRSWNLRPSMNTYDILLAHNPTACFCLSMPLGLPFPQAYFHCSAFSPWPHRLETLGPITVCSCCPGPNLASRNDNLPLINNRSRIPVACFFLFGGFSCHSLFWRQRLGNC